ncbi:MAG: hypothetical protein HQ578_03005 [Chloroflexi bacterium]|nr:hypothetical protein [Chloroflexota bacterium]
MRFGVMLAGPGYPGPAPDRRDWHEEHENHVLAFAEQAQPDDIVILKKPWKDKQWQILAVGRVAGGYEYLEQFDDVEGWDIRHCRRVQWFLPKGNTSHLHITKGLPASGRLE